MLTIEKLKEMKPDTIFAQGTTIDNPDGVNMANTGQELKWVAVRGGIWDWAIYCGTSDKTDEDIKSWGDKITSEENIKKLVKCDRDSFEMYRY